MDTDREAARVLLESIPDVIAIYRFGSTVEGTAAAGSDIDLAVLAAHPIDPMQRFALQERLAVALRRDVDLVDLRAASTVMRMQVLAGGIVLAEPRPDDRARFETYAYSAYARLNEERRAILEQVRRDRTVYGG